MPTRGSKDPNGRALRGRRAHTTFALLSDPVRQIWDAFNNRANTANADAPEAAVNGCLYDRFKGLYTKTATKPSLVIVPARFKSGTLYSQIPSSNADFTVTRNTEARRFDSAGLIASVASGIPRLDYYTSGGVTGCPALLVEPSGSNGILNSSDLTNANWVLGPNLSRTAESVLGLNGANLTVQVSGSGVGSSNGANVRSSNNIALTSGLTYTISFFVKKTGTHTIAGYYVPIIGAASGDLGGGFDVSGSFNSGSIYNSAGTTNRIRRVEQWGTDVYRCSETFTMTASGTLTNIFLAPIGAVNNHLNSAVGTQLAFAGPQVEQGSVPTSFIPTTTGTGSRSADMISVSGAVSGSIGQQSGTVYCEFQFNNTTTNNAGVFSVESTNNQNRILLANASPTTCNVQLLANNSVIFTTSIGTLTVGQYYKIAVGYSSGNTKVYLNGNSTPVITNTSGYTMAAALSRICLGNYENAAVQATNSRIRSLVLYAERLTDAEMIALTT